MSLPTREENRCAWHQYLMRFWAKLWPGFRPCCIAPASCVPRLSFLHPLFINNPATCNAQKQVLLQNNKEGQRSEGGEGALPT